MAIQYRMNRFDVETIEGLSTDTKPPYPKEGATFRELDTDRKWIYTEKEGWILIGGGGGEELVLHGINQGWSKTYSNTKDGVVTSIYMYPGMWVTPTSDFVVELTEDKRIIVNGTEVTHETVATLYGQMICIGLDGEGFDVSIAGFTKAADGRLYFTEYWSGSRWYAPARLEIKGFRMTIESSGSGSAPDLELDLDIPYSFLLGYGDQDPLDRFVLSMPFHDAANPSQGIDVASIGGDQYCVIACLQRYTDRSSAGSYSNEYVAIADGDRTLTVIAERGDQLVEVSFKDGHQADTSIVNVQFVSGVASDGYEVYVMHPAFVRPSSPVEMPWKSRGKGDVPADMWVYSVEDGVAIVTGISQEWERPEGFSAVVPDRDPDGHPVMGIGDQAFYGEDRMGSLRSNALSIGVSACRGCEALESVSLPFATYIESSAFQVCTSLSVVDLPRAVTVGSNALRGCEALTAVSLPQATTIGDYAFQNCKAMASISLPLATSIGRYSFSNCLALEAVEFPLVETVGEGAFSIYWEWASQSSLYHVSLPSAASIGVGAFERCENLNQVYLAAVTSIAGNAFHACDGISHIQLGPLETLSGDAFPDWTFYDIDRTTVLSKTAEALARQSFTGTAAKLVMDHDE